MAKLTIEIEDRVLSSAIQYAARQNLTVEELIRRDLTSIAGESLERRRAAVQELLRMSEKSTARLGPGKCSRKKLYNY